MKVLLISPKDPEVPTNLKFLMGGENTYTQTLLAYPPEGVEYIHYQKVLGSRVATYTAFQSLFSALMTARILPPDSGFQALKLKEKFDLVHAHTYCLKLQNYTGPVVLSDSSSNALFLRDYLGWSRLRIKVAYKLRKWINKNLGVFDPNLNLYQAKKLIVWSEFAKRIHQELGCDPRKITVIPPGIAELSGKRIEHEGFNILFVGVWFERKGGKLLLDTYRILKEKYSQLRLSLVGELPKGMELSEGIWQTNYLSRGKLINEVFPYADVLVLAPPKAEGYGLVVEEAMSFGIPVVVSNIYALPEMVQDSVTGFVVKPGSVEDLVAKLEILIKNPSLRRKMGVVAHQRFREKFWIEKTNEKLLKVYQEALKR
ncbi:MAG: glycosyltransferase family 4 protein [bacterium]|nr:glycosyltransferase family 4 protein [bacterium]